MKDQLSSFWKQAFAGLIATMLLVCLVVPANAQRASGDVGIGAHIGQPTGLSLKFYKPTTSVDVLAAWDLDDFFYINVHGIWDEHLNDAQTVHFYYGPGVFLGLRDRGGDVRRDETAFGVSGAFGIDFLIRRFELFAQLTPRIELIESTDFDLGGGIGFRFYL
ncbi:MAG: hypothetical protein R3301_08945 [Saprospiraceae bacterium]|nr:hypothetical protein [Saprospiraceae bacterium]